MGHKRQDQTALSSLNKQLTRCLPGCKAEAFFQLCYPALGSGKDPPSSRIQTSAAFYYRSLGDNIDTLSCTGSCRLRPQDQSSGPSGAPLEGNRHPLMHQRRAWGWWDRGNRHPKLGSMPIQQDAPSPCLCSSGIGVLCFAAAAGIVWYYPRHQRPLACRALQSSGGEPSSPPNPCVFPACCSSYTSH